MISTGRRRNGIVRVLIQIAFAFATVAIVFLFWGPAGAHNICPFAVAIVPSMYLAIGGKIFWLAGIVIGVLGIVSCLIFPRVFCGWVCPVGLLFEFFAWIGKKIGISAKPVPDWLNEKMRFFAFGILVFVIVFSFAKRYLTCQIGCPFFWCFAVGSVPLSLINILSLAVILILAFYMERSFCRYVCGYGAILQIFAPFSLFRIYRNIELCPSCKQCNVCPMGIDVMNKEFVRSAHCISCDKCIDKCPKGALSWVKR